MPDENEDTLYDLKDHDETLRIHEARTGWIGVDLDGTLAIYDGWKGVDHIGDPIPRMVDRVRTWLAAGREVKIFTARAAHDYADREQAIAAVRSWCLVQFGRELEVTCEKDGRMAELWDDRAVGLITNTGLCVGGTEARRISRESLAECALDRLAHK